ncbi:Exoribonuclease II [Balamuthia mandrillaris]
MAGLGSGRVPLWTWRTRATTSLRPYGANRAVSAWSPFSSTAQRRALLLLRSKRQSSFIRGRNAAGGRQPCHAFSTSAAETPGEADPADMSDEPVEFTTLDRASFAQMQQKGGCILVEASQRGERGLWKVVGPLGTVPFKWTVTGYQRSDLRLSVNQMSFLHHYQHGNLSAEELERIIHKSEQLVARLSPQKVKGLWQQLSSEEGVNQPINLSKVVQFLQREASSPSVSTIHPSSTSSSSSSPNVFSTSKQSAMLVQLLHAFHSGKDNVHAYNKKMGASISGDNEHTINQTVWMHAAHRLLYESPQYFARKHTCFYVLSKEENERMEAQLRLLDLDDKEHVLFLLRLHEKISRANKNGISTPSNRLAQRLQQQQTTIKQKMNNLPVLLRRLARKKLGEEEFHAVLRSSIPTAKNEGDGGDSSDDWEEQIWKKHVLDEDSTGYPRLMLLKQYATNDPMHEESTIARSVFVPLNSRALSFDAFDMLVRANVLLPFDNPHHLAYAARNGLLSSDHPLYRKPSVSTIPAAPATINAAAARPLPPLPMLPITASGWMEQSIWARHDMRHHTVFTIDSASTKEVDDGISIDPRKGPLGERWIYVHIADPTSDIHVHSEIDVDIRKRATSIYLPETTIPMMSPSHYGRYSLEANQETNALTFAAELSADGELLRYEIFPSTISKVQKLTYEHLDDILRHNGDRCKVPHDLAEEDVRSLLELNQLAATRSEYRRRQGSFSSHLPKPSIKLEEGPNGKIHIHVSVESGTTAAQELVAEMMILANNLAAKFAMDKGIAVPFRSQLPPRGMDHELLASIEAKGLPSLIKNMEMIKYMSPARIAVAPAPHYALGLDAYLMVTSPIRRYVDVLAHYQLKSYLATKDVPFKHEEMASLLPAIEDTMNQVKNISRASERYWVFHFLQQKLEENPAWVLEGMVLGVDAPPSPLYPFYLVRIMLRHIGISCSTALPSEPQVGEVIRLRIKDINPYKLSLSLRETF